MSDAHEQDVVSHEQEGRGRRIAHWTVLVLTTLLGPWRSSGCGQTVSC